MNFNAQAAKYKKRNLSHVYTSAVLPGKPTGPPGEEAGLGQPWGSSSRIGGLRSRGKAQKYSNVI